MRGVNTLISGITISESVLSWGEWMSSMSEPETKLQTFSQNPLEGAGSLSYGTS